MNDIYAVELPCGCFVYFKGRFISAQICIMNYICNETYQRYIGNAWGLQKFCDEFTNCVQKALGVTLNE